MAVTPVESAKLLEEAQKCLNELRDPKTPHLQKQMLAKRIGDLVRWATNIELKVDPNSGAMSGRVLPRKTA